MSYLGKIEACNQHDLSHFRPFWIEGERVGWIRPSFAAQLARWPETFQIDAHGVHLAPELQSFEERSSAVEETVRALIDEGVIDHWHGEYYPVTASVREQARLVIDRGSAAYFGIRAFGQHLNCYVCHAGKLKLWVGRRSPQRTHSPGKLDHLVAGGLPHGIGLVDNLVKECSEEAGIPAELARQAVPSGAVTYFAETDRGLKPDLLYCYDLELPEEFVPRSQDGETVEFHLWPVARVAELVRETDEFKLNCNLVIIDFMIRRGYIQPDHPDYPALVAGLHPVQLPFLG